MVVSMRFFLTHCCLAFVLITYTLGIFSCLGHDYDTPIIETDTLIIRKLLDTNNLIETHVNDAVILNFKGEVISIELMNSNLDSVVLPDNVFELNSLEIIKLFGNNLISLPDNLKNITQLRELYIGENDFSNFPDVILEMTFLEKLSFPNNHTKLSIPSNISNLKNLKYLGLNWNKIDSLPNSIGELDSLQMIYVNNNNLSNLPVNITKLDLLVGDYEGCSCPANNFGVNKLCEMSNDLIVWLDKYDEDWRESQKCIQ